MTTLRDIGIQLREERQRRKLYKVGVAEATGVHRNTVSDLEAGVANVELNTLMALCEFLGLEVKLVPKRARRKTRETNTQADSDGSTANTN